LKAKGEKMIAYFNGKFINKEEIRISPDDRGFLFADGLYEVIRCYKGRLFRLKDHIRRLNYGTAQLNLAQSDFTPLETVTRELISRNKLMNADATVYLQVTRGVAKRSHPFPDPAPELTVYAAISPFDPAKVIQQRQVGISTITVPDIRWARCDIKTVGLTANVLANQRAVESGAEEAIFIRDGVMVEGSHSNFMAVFDDVLVTAPLSNYILGGITRQVVVEICRRERINLEQRPIFEKDAHKASEMMILGTTTEITPIVQLDGRPVGNGTPGPAARFLQVAFNREIEKALGKVGP
jgi:D-alanine transaminase